MKSSKVLIVEDQKSEAEYLKSVLIQSGYEVPAMASSLPEAVECFTAYQPDFSLIDIYLDGRPDGILFAREISRHKLPRRPFLFLTSAEDSTTFRLALLTTPAGYLLKPFNQLELQYAIELALGQSTQEASQVNNTNALSASQHTTLFIKRGNGLIKILLDEIKYIEVDGKYSIIICVREKFLVQQPLKELHHQLPSDQFFRIHRNYIVNIKEVSRIEMQNNEIVLKDGKSLMFSRRCIDEFLSFFKVFK